MVGDVLPKRKKFKMRKQKFGAAGCILFYLFATVSSVLGYLPSDLNKDTKVDLTDYAIFAQDWLGCNDPSDSNCNQCLPAAEGFGTGGAGSVVTIRIQAPQVMAGPDNRADMQYFGLRVGNELSSYTSNSYTYNRRGSTLQASREETNFYYDTGAALVPGAAGSIDERGAWLMYAEVDDRNPNLIRGWYHCEKWAPGPTDVLKTMAYAESYDGGRTFQKVCAENPSFNYPNNQFITCWTGYNGNAAQDSTGDAHIIRIGDYYYAYFLSTSDWLIHLARSLVSSHGLPGTWWKYYNGGFTQPGLGGNSTTPFPKGTQFLWGKFVVWNEGLSKFMDLTDRYLTGYSGIYLGFSNDNVLGWQTATSPYPFVVYEGDSNTRPSWDRVANANELHAYPGLCPLDGDNNGGIYTDKFWYTVNGYINPGEGFTQRYSLRQKITLQKTTSTLARDQVGRIEFVLFGHDHGNDTWATTYNTFGHYRKIVTLGYLCSANIAGTYPLYDLYISSHNDHMVSTNPSEAQKLRLLGYAFNTQYPGTVPIYRTWDPVKQDHSVTLDAGAAGVEFLLGYIFPAVGDEIFAFRYDSTEQTERPEGITPVWSGEQGWFNWYYKERKSDNSLVNMVYSPSGGTPGCYYKGQVWKSSTSSTPYLTSYGGRPGNSNRAVREWHAIDDGYIFINAKAFDIASDGGNGVDVIICKNDVSLWQKTITNQQPVLASFGLKVLHGDVISFEIDSKGNDTGDLTYFRPTIWFQKLS